MKSHLKAVTTAFCAVALVSAAPADDASPRATVVVDPADPHAVIPSDPSASLVDTGNGLAVITGPSPDQRALAASGEPAAPEATVVQPGPGQTTAVVQPGEEQRASFGAGARPTTHSPDELRERQARLRDRGGPYLNSITIAPRAFADLDRLSGLRRDDVGGALGLQLDRVLATPLSLVLGADLGSRDRGPGLTNDTFVGVNAGLNLYLLGGDNRGLYLGPRASFAATGYDSRLNDTGDRFGYGGEVGLRAVTGGGFTAGIAAGVMNQTRGAIALDRAGIAASPADRRTYGYTALQLGWSW